jgi:hypothetical protein
VTEAISLDGTGAEVEPVGSDLLRVIGPFDAPMVGVDPLAPVELCQLGSEPPFGVDLAIEALRVLSPIESSAACPLRRRPVGSMLDGPPHRMFVPKWSSCRLTRSVSERRLAHRGELSTFQIHSFFKSDMTRRAALCPGAPVTPPPGWVPEPHR